MKKKNAAGKSKCVKTNVAENHDVRKLTYGRILFYFDLQTLLNTKKYHIKCLTLAKLAELISKKDHF